MNTERYGCHMAFIPIPIPQPGFYSKNISSGRYVTKYHLTLLSDIDPVVFQPFYLISIFYPFVLCVIGYGESDSKRIPVIRKFYISIFFR